MNNLNEEHICCICGKAFSGWGNNPYPVVEDEAAHCCDDCNWSVVIPARMKAMGGWKGATD